MPRTGAVFLSGRASLENGSSAAEMLPSPLPRNRDRNNQTPSVAAGNIHHGHVFYPAAIIHQHFVPRTADISDVSDYVSSIGPSVIPKRHYEATLALPNSLGKCSFVGDSFDIRNWICP